MTNDLTARLRTTSLTLAGFPARTKDRLRLVQERIEAAERIDQLNAKLAAAEAERDRMREALGEIDMELGPKTDWEVQDKILREWTGSAFLAGEKVKDVMWHKVELHSFLTGLFGYFIVAKEACGSARAALKNEEPDNG